MSRARTCLLLAGLVPLLLGATTATPKRQHLGTIGDLTITAQRGTHPERLRYRYPSRRELLLEVPRHTAPLDAQDINADGVLEIWIEYYEGDEVLAFLYQIDLRQRPITWQSTASVLGATGSRDDARQNISLTDLDGDGKQEILVQSPTHELYGELFSAGAVKWVDVYQLAPKATKANARYPSVYRAKQDEIQQEITRLGVKRKAIERKGKEEPQFVEVHELHMLELDDQVRVYETWLRQIAAILDRR
jgi:hypothetical protein